MNPRFFDRCALVMPVVFVLFYGCLGSKSPVDAGVFTSDNGGGGSAARYGLIGGDEGSPNPLALTVNVIDINNPIATQIPIAGSGGIFGVAISSSGTVGLLGGDDGLNAAAYVVDVVNATGTTITNISGAGTFFSVAMDPTGQSGVLGGGDLVGPSPLAFTVDIATHTATTVPSLPPNVIFEGAAISAPLGGSSPVGLLVGTDATVSPSIFHSYFLNGNSTITLVPSGTGQGALRCADSNGVHGICGGHNDTTPQTHPIAFFANLVASTDSSISMPVADVGQILSVAVSSNGRAILGGGDQGGGESPLAYTCSSSSPTAVPVSNLFTPGLILSVDIDAQGVNGILGGVDNASFIAHAYTLQWTSGTATAIPITLPVSNDIEISAVAISSNGQVGILGGLNNSIETIAYLVTGIQNATLLNPAIATNLGIPAAFFGHINSAAMDALLLAASSVPTIGLKGNNWTLADYININAADAAAYLLPSQIDGTLNQALESVAPTRNAFSLFALDNSLFFARSALTIRSQDARLFNRSARMQGSEQGELGYLAGRNDHVLSTSKRKGRPNQIWGELIGADAYQKAQQQTPKFQPITFGFVLGYDYEKEGRGRIGGGLSYMHTHVNERENAGHSTINQELIFLYALLDRNQFYADFAIWFGLFQTANVRNIHMTGFNFRSASHPRGLQFDPHLEIGYSGSFYDDEYIFEPFFMMDWVHNWQLPYEEVGNGPFKFGQKMLHSSMLRNELGLRFYETFSFEVWKLTLQEAASYVYKKPYSVGFLNAYLVGAPGNFTVETLSWRQNLGSAAVQFLFEPMDSRYPSGVIAYRGEFGSRYQSHQLGLNVEWGF